MVLLHWWKKWRSRYRRYCKLDTWAMVNVWQKLKKAAGII